MALTLAVHATLPRTRANGPGVRFTVWTQGCSLACAGCFNPETHARGGPHRPVPALAAEVLAEPGIDGLTLTGGEPLEQPAAVAELCARVRAADLGVVVLTGFTPAEIAADPARRAAVAHADTVVAGRYNRHRPLGSGLRGSANKLLWHLSDRYTDADFDAVPDLEVTIDTDGALTVTGMHPAAPGAAR